MIGPLIEALMPLFSGPRLVASLVFAIGATFLGAWLGGETGAAIAFFVTFVLVYALILFAERTEGKEL